MAKKTNNTFTKKMIKAIVIVALIDMQLPFALAFLGREQIAEELGKVIVVEIVGVTLVYCLKSFLETREEEKNKLIRMGDITGFDDAEVADDSISNYSFSDSTEQSCD